MLQFRPFRAENASMIAGAERDVLVGAPGAPPQAVSDRPAVTGRRALSTDRTSLLVAGALAAVVFAASWYRHATFRSTTLDLAVFEQAIWKLAHFQAPEVTTIGWNAFADHFSPVLVAFAPFYRLAATPLWLFAAQGLALGAGYLALRLLLDAIGLPRASAPVFAIAYLANPLLWNAALFDFHPTTLAVPFLLVGLRAALTDDRRMLVVCSVALLLLRDDLGLAVAAMAVVGASRHPASRRFRLVLASAGLLWVAGAGALASALGSDRHWDFHYGYVADTPTAAVLHPVRTIARVATGIVEGGNTVLVAAFLAPLALLPLLAPLRLALAGVLALPLLVSAGPQFHSPEFHYGAPLFPFLLLAAASGFLRLPDTLRSPHATTFVVAGACLSLLILGPPATGALTARTIDPVDARAALALVQEGDVVVAPSNLGPHVAHRSVLLSYPFPFATVETPFPLADDVSGVRADVAATVDVILVARPQSETTERLLDRFRRSPLLEPYDVVGDFRDVTVYRRLRF